MNLLNLPERLEAAALDLETIADGPDRPENMATVAYDLLYLDREEAAAINYEGGWYELAVLSNGKKLAATRLGQKASYTLESFRRLN